MQKLALIILALFATGLVACNRPTGATSVSTAVPVIGSELPTAAPSVAVDTATAPVLPTDTIAPTQPPTDIPTPTAEPSPTTVADPTEAADLAINYTDLILHPVPKIYAGDKVTFQLLPHVPDNLHVNEVTAAILVDGVQVAGGPLDRRNWNGQAEASMSGPGTPPASAAITASKSCSIRVTPSRPATKTHRTIPSPSSPQSMCPPARRRVT